MRFIRENNPPEALIRCLALRREAGQPLDYDDVGQVEVNGTMVSVKTAIREARIAAQGGICAYTMMRIDENSCHNEHLVPRSVSKDRGQVEQTLDYRNIVACYPKKEAKGGCGFGAAVRGTKDLAVTPLDQACERRIRFDRASGKAEPTNADDAEVQKMIDEVLVLNHDTLEQRRLEAFDRAGVGTKSQKPLSAQQSISLAEEILVHRRGSLLTPFCVAIAHAARAHAEVIEKRKRRHGAKN